MSDPVRCAACGVRKAVASNGISFCPHCDQALNCPKTCAPCGRMGKYTGTGPRGGRK